MASALYDRVRRRAAWRCEYCRLPQVASSFTFEVDHVIARKHGGRTTGGNLALSCYYCNSFKGSDISGLDPETGKLARPFQPRRHTWAWHFRWDGPLLIGRTKIRVLRINDEDAVQLRRLLMAAGVFTAD